MANYSFKPTEGLVIGYAQQAMRDAVMGALFKPEVYYHTPHAKLLERLRRRWYTRLSELRAQQWTPLLDDMNWQYYRNCPPFGVQTETKARCCHRTFCPFCWARDVTSPLYNQVLSACFNGKESLPVRLALFRYEYRWPRQVKLSDIIKVIRLPELRQRELQYVSQWSSAFVAHTLEPYPKYHRLVRKTLVVMPEKAVITLPTEKRDLLGLTVLEPPDHKRQTIVKLVVSATRYADRLLGCPPDELLGWLDATTRVRMRSYLGNFRNRNVRDV